MTAKSGFRYSALRRVHCVKALMTDLLEILRWVWTILAVFGVGVCIWALVDSRSDRRALSVREANGQVLAAVERNIRTANAGFILHAFFLVLGILALATPRSLATPYSITIALGFILVAATNVRAVALNQLERVRMRRQR